MSNYTKSTNFTAKDSLSTGDPAKLIKGSLFDTEFDAIATAITTKFDTNNLASEAEAETGTSATVLMTPQRVTDWSQAGAGFVEDLWNLTDPAGDRIFFFDNTDNQLKFLSASTGISISGTNITTNDAAIVHDNLSGLVANEHINHASVDVIAGTGMTGGGAINASRTLNVIGGDGITANANDIAVNSTVIRTTGNQTLGGTKTFSSNISMTGTRAIDATTRLNLTGATVSAGESGGNLGFFGSAGTTKKSIIGTITGDGDGKDVLQSLLVALDQHGFITNNVSYTP